MNRTVAKENVAETASIATLRSSAMPNGTTAVPSGLSREEAQRRLEAEGPNRVQDEAPSSVQRLLAKLWAPVPWMLEAAIVLELVLREYTEAAVIMSLLLFNAALSYFQESRAQATLQQLKARLALSASVRRDGSWMTVPADDLVHGDIVKLSLGAIVPADVRLTSGTVLVDQSMLTGESVPAEAGAGFEAYAGALIRRGEAVGEVTATGERTKFGGPRNLCRVRGSRARSRRRSSASSATWRSSTAA